MEGGRACETGQGHPDLLVKRQRIEEDAEAICSKSPTGNFESLAGSESEEYGADRIVSGLDSNASIQDNVENLEVPPASANEDETEDESMSFHEWLIGQKQKGTNPRDLLKIFGLSVASGEHSPSEEELWVFIISHGIGLLEYQNRGREKLMSVNTLDDMVELLKTSEKILVLTGAGISVSCGIPDFRSENGIYSRLEEYRLPSPQSMFDLSFFRENPRPFFAFARELFPASPPKYIPSPSHYFIRMLEEKGKLLRNYTQNIDGLELLAGVSREKALRCHGHFESATCMECGLKVNSDSIRDDVMSQRVPMCKECGVGVVKPDIIFFGEKLPSVFHEMLEEDLKEADLVIVMGSSLKVNPVRGIAFATPAHVPVALINRELVGQPNKFDIELMGNCNDIVKELCRQLDWELPEALDSLEASQGAAVEGNETSYKFVSPNRYLFPGAIV